MRSFKIKKHVKRLLVQAGLEPEIAFLQQRYLRRVGWVESRRQRLPVDWRGQPLPWYTYSAIEYISQFDFTDKLVFEYGSGNSTLYWANRAKKVIAVENDSSWFQHVTQLPSCATIKLRSKKPDYVSEIAAHGPFDIIVIDGAHRWECAQASTSQLKPGGFIILDNSDWWPKTAEWLRKQGLIQVDFSGIGPINNYTWTTSLFLTRDVELSPLDDSQPAPPIGSIRQNKEAILNIDEAPER